jgi:hypothetical protein
VDRAVRELTAKAKAQGGSLYVLLDEAGFGNA